MRKVLFLNFAPPHKVSHFFRLINRRWPPLDLLQIATLLKQYQIEVDIIDFRVRFPSLRKLQTSLAHYDFIFINSTPLDRWQCPEIDPWGFINFVKALNLEELLPDFPNRVCLLGAQSTLYPELIYQQTCIPLLIKGQPEGAILKLLTEPPKDTSLSGALTILEFPPVNPDLLSPPDYSKINLRDYYYELLGGNLVLLETQRGCPYHCGFCLKVMYGSKVFQKDIKKVKAEIDYVVRELGAKNLYFIDLEFTLSRERTLEISDYILTKGYKLNWCCQTRVDRVDLKLLKLMKRAGCKLIHYGIESGSQRILDMVRKGVTLSQIDETIKLTKKCGIQTAGFFILGFPTETEAELMKTLNFALTLDLDYASFHPFIPYPTLPILKEYPLTSFPSLELIQRYIKRAYSKFYLRPRFFWSLLRQPRLFGQKLFLFLGMLK